MAVLCIPLSRSLGFFGVGPRNGPKGRSRWPGFLAVLATTNYRPWPLSRLAKHVANAMAKVNNMAYLQRGHTGQMPFSPFPFVDRGLGVPSGLATHFLFGQSLLFLIIDLRGWWPFYPPPLSIGGVAKVGLAKRHI